MLRAIYEQRTASLMVHDFFFQFFNKASHNLSDKNILSRSTFNSNANSITFSTQ